MDMEIRAFQALHPAAQFVLQPGANPLVLGPNVPNPQNPPIPTNPMVTPVVGVAAVHRAEASYGKIQEGDPQRYDQLSGELIQGLLASIRRKKAEGDATFQSL